MAFIPSLTAICCRWAYRASNCTSKRASKSVVGTTRMCRRDLIDEPSHPECRPVAVSTTSPVIWLPDEQDTYRLGQLLGEVARAGDALFLDGDLGAGKTCLARGYVHSARRDSSLQVTSPTYLLVNTYPQPQTQSQYMPSPTTTNGREPVPTIYHMDLWRLQDASNRPIVDFEHLFNHAIALIEWPDRIDSKSIPRERLDITLQYPISPPQSPGIPAQQAIDDKEDDVWGFETATNQGRTATLTPHGRKWVERIRSLCETRLQQISLRDTTQYTLTDHPPCL